jgi:hypothetical protein
MVRALFLVLLLADCAASPEELTAVTIGAGVASIATIHRTPFDAVYSLISGRNCSIVWLDQAKTYCKPVEPPPEPPRYCTRSLGRVDCWLEPARLPGQTREVADGPRVLTPQQEEDRTRRWPE